MTSHLTTTIPTPRPEARRAGSHAVPRAAGMGHARRAEHQDRIASTNISLRCVPSQHAERDTDAGPRYRVRGWKMGESRPDR